MLFTSLTTNVLSQEKVTVPFANFLDLYINWSWDMIFTSTTHVNKRNNMFTPPAFIVHVFTERTLNKHSNGGKVLKQCFNSWLSPPPPTFPCALLCLFKYSRQCCWSVWERRAHGAALPLRSVKQPSHRTGDRKARLEPAPAPNPHCDLNKWLERLNCRGKCRSGADGDGWACGAINITPSSSGRLKRVAVYLRHRPVELNRTETLCELMGLMN